MMLSVLSQQHRFPAFVCVVFCCFLIPQASAAQTSTTHPRIEVGGGTGLTALAGDLFYNSTSGVELSAFGSYHVGHGFLMKASAAVSAVGDGAVALEEQDSDGRGPLGKAGFDILLLSIGPVFRFSPPASLVAGHVGGRLVYMEPLVSTGDNALGGGLTGGMTFWLTDRYAVDSDISATLLRRRTTAGDGSPNADWAAGRIITGKLAIVVAF